MSDAHLSPQRVEPTRLPAGRVWLLLCISVALWPRASEAQVRAPIPELTSERVYVIGVDDEYRSLRDEIAHLERASPQTYYVVILRSAGPGRRATHDYLEALVERWEDQARQKGLKFDRRRSVIIVVDIENRKIFVRGGEELRERYGFRDPYIERDLLSQYFSPYARAGDYAQGLRVLVAQIDRWIAARDKDLRSQVDQKAKAVTALEQSTAAELGRARRAGAPLGDIEEDWERARKQAAAARADAGTDDRKALDALTSAEAIMTRVRDEVRVRLDRHRLYTRTVPLALLGALGLGGLAALGLLYYRKRHLQGIVAEQFQAFRDKAVALMDQLDALRQRHKTLPATDPDFTAPLSGATLALYNEVEADLNRLWDRWLKAMEVWDQAQKLLRADSGLAIKQAEEARKLLAEGDIDELIHQSNSCTERLDRLNRGHEQARDALKAGQRELAALRKSFDQSAEAGLSTVSHPKEIETAEALLTEAEGMIPADPIGAEELIGRSRQALAAATVRPDQKPARPREARPSYAYGPADEVAAAAAKFRSVMARLGFTNLMGLLIRAWIAVWALALLIGLLTPLMPLALFILGFVIILAGLWALWRTVVSWFWFGM
ncbi:MAG: TPM domain-containing protein [Planctomycetaceae bacterium]|nr:TPM domain-containing protein [Planctomycetaceae bacterium]